MMFTAWLIIGLLLQSAPVRSTRQSVDDVLAAVSKNEKEFEELLPDFVCDEEITSTAYESGKVKDTRMVDSFFTAVRKPSATRDRLLEFTETRDIFAIDTRPAPQGTKMPKLPLAMFGGFGAVLSMTFSPEILTYHKYELDHAPDETGRLVIHFATKEDQLKVRTLLNGESLINKDTGTAWIDPGSMQVVRLERDFLNLPGAFRRLRNTVEYAPVNFGDHLFWLPRSMRTDVTDRDTKKTKTFLAEYTNCKRFTADIKIVP